jgi:type III secretion protein Q
MFHRACAPIETVLPRFDAPAAHASRLLHDQRFARAWRRVAPGLELVPAAMPPSEPLQRLRVTCDSGVVEILLASRESPALGMAAARVPKPGAASRTLVLQQLAAEALFGTVLRGLQQLGLGGARAAALLPFDDALELVPPSGWCVARRASRELATFVVREVPAAACETVRDHLRGGAGGGLRSLLALRGAVSLAQRPVRRALLRSLAPGDILLMSVGVADTETPGCEVRWGLAGTRRWCAPAHVDDFSLTIQGAPRMIDDAQDPGVDLDLPGGPDALGELDIPVRFEVETVPVPLGDLEALAPGYVIELSAPLASAPLRLVACGRVVGTAELVAVGDRLGARITRMVGRDAIQSPA